MEKPLCQLRGGGPEKRLLPPLMKQHIILFKTSYLRREGQGGIRETQEIKRAAEKRGGEKLLSSRDGKKEKLTGRVLGVEARGGGRVATHRQTEGDQLTALWVPGGLQREEGEDSFYEN